jgi:hypothetical protein
MALKDEFRLGKRFGQNPGDWQNPTFQDMNDIVETVIDSENAVDKMTVNAIESTQASVAISNNIEGGKHLDFGLPKGKDGKPALALNKVVTLSNGANVTTGNLDHIFSFDDFNQTPTIGQDGFGILNQTSGNLSFVCTFVVEQTSGGCQLNVTTMSKITGEKGQDGGMSIKTYTETKTFDGNQYAFAKIGEWAFFGGANPTFQWEFPSGINSTNFVRAEISFNLTYDVVHDWLTLSVLPTRNGYRIAYYMPSGGPTATWQSQPATMTTKYFYLL